MNTKFAAIDLKAFESERYFTVRSALSTVMKSAEAEVRSTQIAADATKEVALAVNAVSLTSSSFLTPKAPKISYEERELDFIRSYKELIFSFEPNKAMAADNLIEAIKQVIADRIGMSRNHKVIMEKNVGPAFYQEGTVDAILFALIVGRGDRLEYVEPLLKEAVARYHFHVITRNEG